MKQYVIDELRSGDYDRLKSHLKERFGPADLGEIFWIPVESDLLSHIQAAHAGCQPFYFAVELKEGAIACELLVRTRDRIRCDCIAYATRSQRNWLIELIDEIFERLDIYT